MKYLNFVINAWNTISQRRGKENTSYSCPIFLFLSLLKFWLVAQMKNFFLTRNNRNAINVESAKITKSLVVNGQHGLLRLLTDKNNVL